MIVHHYDAFADAPGEGNPAALIEHDHPLSDDRASEISRDIAVPMTAFVDHQLPHCERPLPHSPALSMRWFDFTGTAANLCGHATLAAATHFLTVYDTPAIQFYTPAGWIRADSWTGGAQLRLQATTPTPIDPDSYTARLLPPETRKVLRGSDDALIVVASPDVLPTLDLDLHGLANLGWQAVGVTATHDTHDYQCRWFNLTPIPAEDAVTGTAHIQIAPLWATVTGRTRLRGRQTSRRPGTVHCTLGDDRTIRIAGQCTHTRDAA